jgi:peptidyl-prolyl cis-trans isomerase D
MPKAEAEAQIINKLRQDKSYDQMQDLMAQIEDKIGAGATLEDIAAQYTDNKLITVANLDEDGNVEVFDKDIEQMFHENKDLVDAIFSYNEGEVTQVVEDDRGLVVARVGKIIPTHVLPQEEAKPQLLQYWRETERTAVTQELAENIEAGLEAGESLNTLATRYNLSLIKTMPLSRSESFAELSFEKMKELFDLPQDEAKVLQQGNDYVVAVTTRIYNDAEAMSEADKNFLIRALRVELGREMSEALIQDYASEFKTEVNYNRMGQTEE